MIIRTPSSDTAGQPECEEAVRDAVADLIAAAVDAGWPQECVADAIEQIIKDDRVARKS